MRFDNPLMLWLMAISLPLLAWFLIGSWRRRQVLVTQFIQARLLPVLTTRVSPRREQLRRSLIFLAVVFLFLALARPQWGYSWEEARRRGLDIVIAIDTSRSMLAADLPPNRLARAKLAALDLLRLARSDRLGLVAFAGSAFLQCPLTLDEQAFRLSLDALDTRIIPQGGTAIAAAIETALTAFKDENNFKILVLISDGEDHDERALEAANTAAKKGLRIFTLGAGTAAGEVLRVENDQGQPEFIKDAEGNVVKSRLNEALLQQVATAAEGFYLPLAAPGSVATLYQQGLEPLPKAELGSHLTRRYHERFHWPLVFAILLLALETVLPHARPTPAATPPPNRPAARVAPLLVAAFFVPFHAAGSPASALEHYHAGRYREAQQAYQRLLESNADDPRLAYNLGTAAYRAGDYLAAARAFTNALTASNLNLQQRSFYNLGNTLYQQGDQDPETPGRISLWQQALQSFQAALQLDPNDNDARNNLEFVRQKLEELQQQQSSPDSQDQDNPQPESDQEQEQDGKQESQPGQEQPDPSGESESSPPQQEGSSPESDSPQPKDEPSGEKGEAPPAQQPPPQPDQPRGESGAEPPDGESAEAVPLGQMTPEQARQLLDAQRDTERAMIFLPATNAHQRPLLRDW